MPQFHHAPGLPKLPTDLQPPCPKCRNPMWLVRLTKYDDKHDLRSFECKVCEHSENRIVRFNRSV
jgi:hypothetical protein